MFQINENTSPALKVNIILNQNQKKFKFKSNRIIFEFKIYY